MRKLIAWLTLGGAVIGVAAAEPAPAPAPGDPVVREIYVPFEELGPLLEHSPQRVMLSRAEFDELLRQAHQTSPEPAPASAILLAADYDAAIASERAEIVGRLVVEVLRPGLQVVNLPLSGAGLRRALLDGKAAPIGRGDDGMLKLFVEGIGRHELTLDLVSPLETTAAVQTLSFQGPPAPTRRMHIRVPGSVEVKSGGQVVRRTFDERSQITELDVLLPADAGGQTPPLVMTLNNRLLQQQRVVVARGVLVAEIRSDCDRLHATFSMSILHRPVDSFRFALPDGYDVTDVQSPLVSQWAVESDQSPAVLNVRLREATGGTAVVGIAALRGRKDALPRNDTAAGAAWVFPALRPLDVIGEATVMGILLEDRLKLQTLQSEGLFPIDTTVLDACLPATVRSATVPALRAVAAFYAPTGLAGALRAELVRPTPTLHVSTTQVVTLADDGLQWRAGFTPRPDVERVFFVDIDVPPEWHVTAVTDGGGSALPFELLHDAAGPDGAVRVHVTWPGGIGPGEQPQLWLTARYTPAGWLGEWTETRVAVPAIGVRGATTESGALVLLPGADLEILPEHIEQLTPLDEKDMARFGLPAGGATSGRLAYRFEQASYTATFRVRRSPPHLTARTYSFLTLAPGVLTSHYELVYDVQDARVRRLAFMLPASAPADVTITALGDAGIKEYDASVVNDQRRWNVLLAAPLRGTIRLAVEAQQALGDQDELNVPLPITSAENVSYQSGLIAIQGDAELTVSIAAAGEAVGAGLPRRADVGELAGAEFRPGGATAGGLEVFQFTGDVPHIQAHLTRRSSYTLPPAIVERAEFTTLASPGGVSQTAARLLIRTKVDYLELELPAQAELWSAEVDGQPCQPQREGQHLLLSLPASAATGGAVANAGNATGDAPRDLQIVYALPTRAVAFWGDVDVLGLRLRVPTEGAAAASAEIPMADVRWYLDVPAGYQVVSQGGTVGSSELTPPEPAAWTVARTLYRLAGGVNVFYGGVLSKVNEVRAQARRGVARLEYKKYVSATPGEAGAEGVAKQLASMGYADMPRVGKPAEPPPPPSAPWSLEGVRSLKIELARSGERMAFESLGGAPRLQVGLASTARVDALCWAIAMAVALLGLIIRARSKRIRAGYVAVVILAATLIPLASARPELAQVTNAAFYVAVALVPFYLLAGGLEMLVRRLRPRKLVAAAALVALGLAPGARGAAADPPAAKDQSVVVRFEEPPAPMKVPDDAVIVPYEPQTVTPAGIPRTPADRFLVPYHQFVELWNRVHPDQPIVTSQPCAYALAGASYSGTLADAETLTLHGQLDLDVYVDDVVSVPMQIAGGALAQAMLDGQPARLGVLPGQPAADLAASPAQTGPPGQSGPNAPAAAPAAPQLALQVHGRGRHRLELTVQLATERQGGWRVASGRLPAAPATALALRVDQPDTDVRLGQVVDRRSYDARPVGDTIATALGADGVLDVRWRPRVQEGAVEASLTAESNAILDIREDGLYVTWTLKLDFGRTERDGCTLRVPAEYLVQKVQGPNVRGWVSRAAEGQSGGPLIDVSFLKPTRGAESLVATLYRPVELRDSSAQSFDTPVVDALGAALHRGQVTIRRSPWLTVSTQETAGVTRADAPADVDALAAQAGDGPVSPLGIRVYQSYRFAATPFTLRLKAGLQSQQADAEVQLMLRIAERQRSVEACVAVRAGGGPLHHLRVGLPSDLHVEQVAAPGPFEWSVTREADRSVLWVYLAGGQMGSLAVVIRGTLGETGPAETTNLPVLEVLDVRRQTGDVVVQVDPAFDVRATDLRECEEMPLRQAFSWLREDQRPWARLALKCRSAKYGGTLHLTARVAQVSCTTITNVRLTGTAIEETILLDFSIAHAGIRTVSFLLPAWLADARVSVPMLREKRVTPVSDERGAPVRVQLTLQDEVMGSLRVLVQHDRLLTADLQRAPVPVVETGETNHRWIALENAGRDEVVVETATGVEALVHGQKAWNDLVSVLGNPVTQAYAATGPDPALAYRTHERALIETAGARIGLSETVLVVDAQGTYRAAQTYHIDNSTEQFLEVQLPAGADLWTVRVADQPVKPGQSPGATQLGRVRIPLIKTAAGDLDFAVTLHYGGHIEIGGAVRSVSFPLAHTINVPAELSQVQIYLPEDYEWFDFGGTTRQITDQAELVAGHLGYQTQQAERLIQVMTGNSRLAQLRASANWEALQNAVPYPQAAGGQTFSNRELARETARNDEVMRRAATQAQQIDQSVAAGEGQTQRDNRAKLNDRFDAQQSSQARNVVTTLGDNFRPQEKAAVSRGDFDQAWFSANGLGQTLAEKEQPEEAERGRRRLASPKGAAAKSPPSKDAKDDAGRMRDELAQIQQQAGRAAGQPRQESVELRYQRQLKQQVANMSGQPASRPSGAGDATRGGPIAGGMIGGGAGGRGPATQPPAPTTPQDGVTVIAAEPERYQFAFGAEPATAGLASLNVDLPIRGRAYYFTTPRGDVTITARSLSEASIGMLQQAGVVLAALIVAGAIGWLMRRPRGTQSDRATASTLLMVFGAASVVTGILPILGGCIILVGVLLRVLRRRVKPVTA